MISVDMRMMSAFRQLQGVAIVQDRGHAAELPSVTITSKNERAHQSPPCQAPNLQQSRRLAEALTLAVRLSSDTSCSNSTRAPAPLAPPPPSAACAASAAIDSSSAATAAASAAAAQSSAATSPSSRSAVCLHARRILLQCLLLQNAADKLCTYRPVGAHGDATVRGASPRVPAFNRDRMSCVRCVYGARALYALPRHLIILQSNATRRADT